MRVCASALAYIYVCKDVYLYALGCGHGGRAARIL